MKTFFLKLSAGLENLFLSNNRFIYWLLIIALKPIFTYFLYPTDTRDLNEQNDFMFHIAYIFEYELIAFLYSLVLVYLLYLFIYKKKITLIIPWFKKNLKFILLSFVLKPILTFFLYPADTRDLIRFNPELKPYTQEQNDFAFHIEYIFTYELIAFLYSLVLVYLLYLFYKPITK